MRFCEKNYLTVRKDNSVSKLKYMVLCAVLTVSSSQSGFKRIIPISGCKVVISRGIPKIDRCPWDSIFLLLLSMNLTHLPSTQFQLPERRLQCWMLQPRWQQLHASVTICMQFTLLPSLLIIWSKIISLNVLINQQTFAFTCLVSYMLYYMCFSYKTISCVSHIYIFIWKSVLKYDLKYFQGWEDDSVDEVFA